MDMNINQSATIEWLYPEIYDRAKQDSLTIYLSHTRAASPIRIKYDSDRDGWVIEACDADTEDDCNGPVVDTWHEVAFIEST